MDRQVQSSATSTVVYGLLAAAMGLLYMLYALGILGSQRRSDSGDPHWLGFVFGLIFLLGGTAVVIQTITKRAGSSAETGPAAMPPSLDLLRHVMAFVIVGLLGVVASWVAFGSGQRHFAGSGAIFGETGGRILFGVGAALVWAVLLAVSISAVRSWSIVF
jgi:hypothetical protein